MKKTFMAAGILLIIIGIVLAALPLVDVARTVSEPYEIPMASELFHVQGFEVREAAVTHIVPLTEGKLVNIHLEASGYEHGFPASAELLFIVSANSTEYLRHQGLGGYDGNWTAPLTAGYTFTYSKPYSSTVNVVCNIVVKEFWMMTGYVDVVRNYPALPYETVYVGTVLVIAGIAVFVYGVTRKETSQQRTLEDYS